MFMKSTRETRHPDASARRGRREFRPASELMFHQGDVEAMTEGKPAENPFDIIRNNETTLWH